MSKYGLGRGLTQLRQEMGNGAMSSILDGMEQRVVVKQIPLVQIGANPDQPRKTFTESELADLAASIREKGVLQPILLRAVQNRPYLYEIVAGERRYRASKMAGLNEIPALVKAMTNENAMEIALIENVQRENLNPIEEANAYKNLMEQCDYELPDVARLIGKSESYIRNILRLTTLPDSVQGLIEQGELSASHGRAIAVAENPEDLAHEIIAGNLSVADTARRVKGTARSKNSRAFVSKTLDSATVHDIEARLRNALGASVKLVERRGGAGQINISFSTRLQMEELIEKLTK